MYRLAAPLALLLFALFATQAEAGTYRVYACAAGGGHHANLSWAGPAVAGMVVDTDCTARGSLVGLRIDGGRAIANGAQAALTFTSPPGTAIADFAINRHLELTSNPPLEGTRPLFALYQLGGTVFAGAGDYHNATRDRLHAVGAWYGYPANNATLTRRTNRLRDFGALAGYRGDARTLSITVGCFRRATNCSAPAGGRVYHVLYGMDVLVNDPQPPAPTVAAEGLLAGGQRNGSDPVVVSATDNAGIRRLELLDVTGPGSPQLVGARNLPCDARRPAPCSNINRATVTPTALQVGLRQIIVRTIDAGGNGVDRGPYPVEVVTPSNRGAANGANATEPATLTAQFAKGGRTSRTVRFNRLVRIRGTLRNAQGAPITGARVDLVSRAMRPGAPYRYRKAVTTDGAGNFVIETRARASRHLTIGWRARVNDLRAAATAQLALRARAAATLRASTRRPAVGRRLVLRGRLKSPARGVTVILQGRRPGSRRFTTFADTTTGRSGRFAVSYRFRDPASRGRRFTFRAKLKPSRSYPFETGHSRRITVRVR